MKKEIFFVGFFRFFYFLLIGVFVQPLLISIELFIILVFGSLFFLLDVVGTNNNYFYYWLLSWFYSSWNRFVRLVSFYIPNVAAINLSFILSGITDEARESHTHIIGKSKSGKSSTMELFAHQDIIKGYGIALIEPHGEFTHRFLYYKLFELSHSSQNYKRLVVLDFESPTPTPFNIFNIPFPGDEALRQIRIDTLAQNFLCAFKMLIDSPTDIQLSTLRNLFIATFYLDNGNLLDSYNMLESQEDINPKYIQLFKNLPNTALRNFFLSDFFKKKYEPTKETLKRKLGVLISQRQLQLSLCAQDNRIDFQDIMRNAKILVVKASKAVIGEDSAKLIGNLVHQFLYDEAFRRLNDKNKIPFFCYMDECQNYINDTVIRAFGEVRKYGFHYVLAHQYLDQEMTTTQQKAILNANVKICGKINYTDARKIASEMGTEYLKKRFLRLKSGEFFVQSGIRSTRFVKFPKTFAIKTSKIGYVRHAYYMKKKQFKELCNYLERKKQGEKEVKPRTGKTNKSKEEKITVIQQGFKLLPV